MYDTQQTMDASPQLGKGNAAYSKRVVTHWKLALRIIFRFCFAYFTLICLGQGVIQALIPVPGLKLPGLSALWPLRQITFWTAVHVFHWTGPLGNNRDDDSTLGWIYAFCLLIIALLATIIWSVLDRRRKNYVTLHKWLRLFMRFALASVLFAYGFFKVVPLQMTYPSLVRLVEPFGHFSPMAVLFWSIGASRPYEVFTGLAEVLGGILLIVPRTTALGGAGLSGGHDRGLYSERDLQRDREAFLVSSRAVSVLSAGARTQANVQLLFFGPRHGTVHTTAALSQRSHKPHSFADADRKSTRLNSS